MCAICLCADRFGLGWAHYAICFACHMFMHFPCIHTFFSLYVILLLLLGTFFIFLFSLPLFLFTLVVSMAPKCKSTPTWNLLRSGASSSSDPTPSHVQFHDNKARQDFLENFSRQGIHSECQVIFLDFSNTNLPTIIHNRGWESLCDILVTYPSMLI